MIFLYLFFGVFLVYLYSKKFKSKFYDPLLIFLIFTQICVFFGYYLYADQGLASGTFYDLSITANEFLEAAGIILLSCLMALVGGIGYKVFFGNKKTINKGFVKTIKSTKQPFWAPLVLSTLPLIFLIIGNGYDAIFSRSEYLPLENYEFKVAGSTLAPLGFIFLGFLFSSNKSLIKKSAALLILLVYVLLFFALAKRMLAIGPILFSAAAIIAQPTSRRIKFIATVISTLSILVLLPIPLALRALNEQGLFPFFQYIFTEYQTFFRDLADGLIESALNVTFSLPLTAHVLKIRIPTEYFYISISPLPGGVAGWDKIADQLRASLFIPYNSIGQLWSHGAGYAIAYFLFVGMYFARLGRVIEEYLKNGDTTKALILLSLCFIFVFLAGQYNLRSATRILYYIALFELFLRVLNVLGPILVKRKKL